MRLQDRWILTRCQEVTQKITKCIDGYDIGEAARSLYDFTWGDVCDWYIEMSKPALRGDEGLERRRTAQGVLEEVFKTLLPLLHPFIPFVTEELWAAFGWGDTSIMRAPWPRPQEALRFADVQPSMRTLQDTVSALRNLRAEAPGYVD